MTFRPRGCRLPSRQPTYPLRNVVGTSFDTPVQPVVIHGHRVSYVLPSTAETPDSGGFTVRGTTRRGG